MRAIVEACESGRIGADVAFVGSDYPAALGLEWARERGLDTFAVDYDGRRRAGPARPMLSEAGWRTRVEMRMLGEINRRPGIDLLCLAGFMRLLSGVFIGAVCPIMNIHPSLLPAFPGADGYGDTFRHGCKVGGCTVHFVDCGEDTGPIIGQRAFAIDPDDDIEAVRRKGLELEHELYPECVRLFIEGRLRIVDARQRRGGERRVVKCV